ncbi:MAG: methyl-accepting chemotaxis protein [Granulosicoccus sp.]
MKSIQNMPVRQLSRRFSIGFALVALFIVCVGFAIYQNVSHIKEDWRIYTEEAQQKSLLLTDLNVAVGYGGAIHHFKNYVLRMDAPRLKKVSDGFKAAQLTLNEYRKLPVTDAEIAALEDISRVFADYSASLAVISAMANDRASSGEIDAAVKIDDSPAVDGLQVLSDAVTKNLAEDAEHMQEDIFLIGTFAVWGSIINMLLLCALLVLLIQTFRAIIRQIGGEPVDIMKLTQKIADGELDDEMSTGTTQASNSIYSAVVSMQRMLRARNETDRQSAAHTERLKQALDNATSNVMVADLNNEIVFINRASEKLFREKQQDIRKTVPSFDVTKIVGENIDIFHKKPTVQRERVGKLISNHQAVIHFGSLTFALSINPVLMDNGERIGTIVEWFDKTDELMQGSEVKALVDAATQGNLSKRIDASDKSGYFGDLIQSMNDLMDVNDRAVGEVKTVFAALAKGDLTVKVKGEYQGVYQQLKTDANSTVDQLTDIISNVKNNALVIATASSELISTNKSLNATAADGARQANIASAAASNVMKNVDEVASASTDLEASVSEITRNVTEAVGVASDAVTLAQSTNTQVRKLTTSSSDIGNVIKVINSIAEQTNLLALNATIEAARAGDAGKGFAVVANEVKELAKGTASATDEISQKIKAIQGDSDTAVKAIGEIGTIIETISDYQNTISEAVNHQNVATQRINDNASEAARGNHEITRTSERVSEGTESTVSAVNQVQASAEELARMAANLSNLVEGFKVDNDGSRLATPYSVR